MEKGDTRKGDSSGARRVDVSSDGRVMGRNVNMEKSEGKGGMDGCQGCLCKLKGQETP